MRLTVNKAIFQCLSLLMLVLISSCSMEKRTIVKSYPVNKPFVYDNKVVVNGNITKDEKNRLTSELDNYWDDSLKVRKIQQFWVRYVIKNPAIFDSNNINRTVNYMNAYLNSQGYYYAHFTDTVKIDTFKNQLRAKITINIKPGKNISIDSVSFDMGDTTLQRLTKNEEKNTLLKKGGPYTKQVISSELDRLVGIYRQNGYYNFSRDDIYASVDSVDTKLLQLTLDPFKQAQIIAEAAKSRRENPTWDIAIEKRPTVDSSTLYQYHIGKIYYYPETKLSDFTDSLPTQKGFLEYKRRELVMRYKKGLFNFKPLREHTYLRSGQLYDENSYYKSINTLGQIGAWQQVDAKPYIRGKDSLDIYFFLVPAIKQSYDVNLEGSLNTSDIGTGNLWGIYTSFSYTNRNVWKRAIQSIETFRTGVELNILNGGSQSNQLFQTFLISLGHTYVFPGIVQPFRNWHLLTKADNKRTLLNVTGSYVDRNEYYRLRSLVTSWGYEWKKGTNVWLYKPLNIELYGIDKLHLLDSLILTNPFLKASFNEGKIISQTLSLIKTFKTPGNPNKTHFLRVGIEEAGGIWGFFNEFKNQIYRYVKVEAEYHQEIKMGKNELAFRAMAGVGYNYGTDSVIGKTLPFFKQFSAGGPNSMRAWGLRQLGMGSSIQSDTLNSSYRDRFGDMQLETNIEYRFPVATIASFKVSSALFADIGNVWNVKKDDTDPNAQFSFRHLTRDLAIGVGSGLRFDFNYFLIRLDFAYKVKDPARQYNNGWMNGFSFTEKRFNGVEVSNLALQLGIGMPF
jgi:hypothetical protein